MYIETTVVTYLMARPSRDLVRAAHQEVTCEWWATRGGFALFISQFVLDESAAGDAGAAAQRLEALRDATLLDVTEDAIVLASDLVAGGGLPTKARRCPPRGNGSCPRDGLSAHMELQTHREHGNARHD